MNTHLLEGLLLGYAYAMPIGAQNVFVIQSAVGQGVPRSYRTAIAVALMDVSLALACVYGGGRLVNAWPSLQGALTVLGASYMAWVGYHILRSSPGRLDEGAALQKAGSWMVLRTAFVLTWFNPQALIDGSVILGTFKAQSHGGLMAFLTGILFASVSWFFGITTLIGLTRRALSTRHLKILHVVCGSAMCALALKMLYSFAVHRS
jgi:L-lysine exporter family protein LysE/ArgO